MACLQNSYFANQKIQIPIILKGIIFPILLNWIFIFFIVSFYPELLFRWPNEIPFCSKYNLNQFRHLKLILISKKHGRELVSFAIKTCRVLSTKKESWCNGWSGCFQIVSSLHFERTKGSISTSSVIHFCEFLILREVTTTSWLMTIAEK